MSVKKEASGRRSIQVEVEVPGTPEEVWQAIATGPGVSAWFVPTRCEEREGGQVVSNFGPGMDVPATITTWQPPERFASWLFTKKDYYRDPTGRIDVVALQRTYDVQKELGFLKSSIEAGRYVDLSVIGEAGKRLR